MILIAGKIPEADRHIDWLNQQLPEPVAYEENLDEAARKYGTVPIVIGPASRKFTAQHVQQYSELKWYHSLSAGVDALPLAQFRQQGVTLTNCSGIHGIPMSEQIMGMMLMFSRNLHNNVRSQMDEEWTRDYPLLQELHGKTLCIVGAGSIGKAVAQRAKAFGMKVIGVKRNQLDMPDFDEVVGHEELDGMLPKSDYVLLLTPLTDETYHLFGRNQFREMKSSAVFLNYARGKVVDEEALIQALRTHEIAGAGLDVFAQEPLPAQHPLWGMNEVIISPHTAGVSQNYYDRALQVFVDNYNAWCNGDPMPTKVNLELGY
ncbi:D-2-hydroxyacid dehydrogenase [Alicyclobacillus sp. SO9]|uniref:D-2-hydroxyacid dehydrogenase n=1 Tax=Alicyclobacillus sp. SO9 TaxID=2665646 RepID=UPI0018E80185|nr:D-2-hydroxyacid dehydrogenase [Alicyclobacillus sp. SO9]QQE78633.1 D-2-hydroxyacid dehydrogenase [Alicyclobacillus sp. SO9]